MEAALAGETDKMVGFACTRENGYHCETKLFELSKVANFEQKLAPSVDHAEHNGVTKELWDYCLPLIQGETPMVKENGLPRFCHLKKVSRKFSRKNPLFPREQRIFFDRFSAVGSISDRPVRLLKKPRRRLMRKSSGGVCAGGKKPTARSIKQDFETFFESFKIRTAWRKDFFDTLRGRSPDRPVSRALL